MMLVKREVLSWVGSNSDSRLNELEKENKSLKG